ncbi:MAG: hypothetical protein JJT93_05130 [Gammaproteobacteria bacterium]|nr:hypothetical protein [Gammaproteobacteria bacterium]TVQ46575.1 MAG: hypothetical protein EA371_10040 [Gammaproteobacteria bacterium]
MRIVLISLMLALPWAAASANDPAVTVCDRLAAHPEDPDRVSAGRVTAEIDLPAAIAACEADLDHDPDNARLSYQLARVLFYAGEPERAMAEMLRAAEAGHRQAEFVYGVFVIRARPHAPTDPCIAERYWQRSARAGRDAAAVNYALQLLRGRFTTCEAPVARSELAAWLQSSLQAAPAGYAGYYQRLLIEDLLQRLAQT